MKTIRLIALVIMALSSMVLLGYSGGSKAQAGGVGPAKASTERGFRAQLSHPNDQAPYHITFQGQLTDQNGNPITNAVNVTFKLYTQPSGGSAIFSEGPVSVTPSNRGLLTYQIGSATTIDPDMIAEFFGSLYLGVTIGIDSEMAPRLLLTGAAYAMSLVPGAVIGANYVGPSGREGVLNALNARSTSSHVGLYAEGGTAVMGFAGNTGNSDGYGGYFINNGGGTASQYGVYASSPGVGMYSESDSSTSQQQSAGVAGVSAAAGGTGGVFTATNGSGIVATANSSGAPSFAGSFTNNGGGFGVYSSVGSTVIAGSYAGYFTNDGSGTGTAYGLYSYSATAGVPDGYSGYFDSNTSNGITVHVNGKIQATGGCCASAAYDIQVKYHGSQPLHGGDVVAMDGNNETIDGTPTLGVVKADANNADLAVGVVQYRMRKIGTGKNEHSGLQVDTQATSFGQGDLLSAVVLGQVRMKVAGAKLGDRLALDARGEVGVAAKGGDNIIGRVASATDKDGYVTVFVNMK